MRCAIVSDIHANLQAWRAVLLDIRAQRVDRILCLGDLVGYGPSPVEVLESVYTTVDHFVLGNHDAAVCGKMDPSLFNDGARSILDWTRGRLGDAALRFLAGQPLTLRAPSFRCAHAGFGDPAAFDYIIEANDALASWRAVPEPLLFVGHTHHPFIHVLGASGRPHRVAPQDFAVEAGKRYVVNVGSVGSPRDGSALASYCILDTIEATVRWRTVPFDIDAYRDTLRSRGVDDTPSYFLKADPRRGILPLRELLSFSPPRTAPVLEDTAPVQDLSLERRRTRRWKSVALAAGTSLLLVSSLGATLTWRHATRTLCLPALPTTTTTAGAAEANGANLVCAPLGDADAPGFAGWALELGDRRRMAVRVERDAADGAPLFVLASGAERGELVLRSLPVRAAPGDRMAMQALFRTAEDFRGELALAAVLIRREADGRLSTNANYQVRAPTVRLAGGWTKATASFALLARSETLCLELRATFRGSVQVKSIQLIRRPAASTSGD